MAIPFNSKFSCFIILYNKQSRDMDCSTSNNIVNIYNNVSDVREAIEVLANLASCDPIGKPRHIPTIPEYGFSDGKVRDCAIDCDRKSDIYSCRNFRLIKM